MKNMKNVNAKKVISLTLALLMLSIVIPYIVVTVQAEAVIIPNGNYTISSDGQYQLSEGYSGIIAISNDVNTVTVTDSVYCTTHNNTRIVIEGERSQALQLTIEDLTISSSNGAGIDFGSAGSFGHELLISGECQVTGGYYSAGIHVPEGVNLTIDKADGLSDDQAQLSTFGGDYGSGIGANSGSRSYMGNQGGDGGNITINGGTISAKGGIYGSGIGGGQYGGAGVISINGGTVIATGGNYGGGAGIGDGFWGTSNESTININGGIITAKGSTGSAGIGGAYLSDSEGNISINGGTVTATGGYNGGAGIGGGNSGSGGNIAITGTPVVIANSGGNGADHIGNGLESTNPWTLKNAVGGDLSYLRFNTGISDAKIVADVIDGEHFTNNQGLWSAFIPRIDAVAYTASKAGYAAVKGTQDLSLVSYGIDIPLTEDNTPPTVNVNSIIMQTGAATIATCDDYGIYGAVYVLAKGESDYTSKAALDEADAKALISLESQATSVTINTEGFDEGLYQVYAVDSAENVSSPCEMEIDNTPPIIDSAVRSDNIHIIVTLNENCKDIAQDNDGGFTVHETGNPGITYSISSIAQGIDERHAVLTTADMGVSGKEGVTVKYTAGENGILKDLAGNILGTNSTGVSIEAWDTTAPTVELSHNNAISKVKQGDEITITAAFNEGMSDAPTITITNGSVAGADMVNFSGDKRTWAYTWTVPDGDAEAAITVEGYDIAGNEYEGEDSLAFTIDNTPPEVVSVDVPGNGTYILGQNLDFSVEFSEVVIVDAASGTPSLTINIGEESLKAEYVSGTGTQYLFRCTLQAGSLDEDGIILDSEVVLNNGRIRDEAGNDLQFSLNGMEETSGIFVDAVVPEVVSVAVPGDNTYIAGDELDFIVNFSEAVTVNAGENPPYLSIILDTGDNVNAYYISGSTTGELVFRYIVQTGHEDTDGITMEDDILVNGGSLKDAAGNNAVLILNDAALTGGIKVDAIAPTLIGAVVIDNTHIIVYLSEVCTNIIKDNDGGFTVFENGNFGITYNVLSIEQGMHERQVMLTTADMGISAKEGIMVKYTAGGNGTVKDMAANAMATDSTGVGAARWDIIAPTIYEAAIGEGNVYIDINVSEGIYGEDDGTTVLTKEKLALVFTNNGGTASDAVISSIKQNNSTVEDSALELAGGDTTVRAFLTITGTPSGAETIEISPINEDSIFDKAGNGMEGTQTTGLKVLNDLKPPVIGDGTILVSAVTRSSLYLSWTTAADEATAQANLQYKVVRSTDNNINSADDAENNGITVQDWSSNLAGKQIIGLTAGTNYYFNVIVRDEAGNKSLYNTIQETTRSLGGSNSISASQSKLFMEIISGYEQLPVELDFDSRTGNAVASLDEMLHEQLFEKAEADESGRKSIILDMPEVEGASSYTLETSITGLSSKGTKNEMLLDTVFGTIGIPDNMLTGLDDIDGEKAAVTISQGDKSNMPSNLKEIIDDRPLVQLTFAVDGRQAAWNNPGLPVTVSIPYTPTAEELVNSEHINVWYIDGSGSVINVPSGRYDPATGMVTFTTTHFSRYVVAYETRTYDDLGNAPWAKKQVEVLASKGIVKGMSEKEYAPSDDITRADFLYSLVRTLGADAIVDGNFDDISRGAYYWKEIAIAKKLGITEGIGDNKFSPNASITTVSYTHLTLPTTPYV
jgi:hypothetical protein